VYVKKRRFDRRPMTRSRRCTATRDGPGSRPGSRSVERGYVDKGYRGHDTENPRRIFISGQKRGVFGIIKRELRRRSAIEPVIGHMKAEGHLGRCYLKGRAGDTANAILSAVGHNFRRILAWLRDLLRLFLIVILRLLISRSALIPAS
jgi:IS5 family transposase